MVIAELKGRGKDPSPKQQEWLDLLRQIPGIEVSPSMIASAIDACAPCISSIGRAADPPPAACLSNVAATPRNLAALGRGSTLMNRSSAGLPVSSATATWKSVSGATKSGWVLADAGSLKGAAVTVYTDQQGNLTGPPLGPAQIASQADAATIGAVAGVVVMSIGTGGILHFVLYRRRLAAWEKDWLITARAWNRQSW